MTGVVFGVEVAVIGMAIVFSSLLGLSLLMDIQGKVVSFPEKRYYRLTGQKKFPVQLVKSELENPLDAKTVALIAAAVAAMEPEKRFLITSICPVKREGGNAWAMAGRQEQMLSFQRPQNYLTINGWRG